MKTQNFNIDLMVPSQPNKDIVFNESLLTIDAFLNISIKGFSKEIPDKMSVGDKYIILSGDHANEICYLPHESQECKYLKPQNGMMVFAIKNSKFFIYEDQKWREVKIS